MSALRDLLDYVAGGDIALSYTTTYVYNTNVNTMMNGGLCCLYTAPANTQWLGVEMWGGGGGGAGVCCCFGGWPGGSGSYVRKFITGLSGGETFTVCAGGTTCCANTCLGCPGFPSYMLNSGSTVVACASGGALSCSRCYFMIGCSCQACMPMPCGSYCGTFGICGVTGAAKGSNYCSGNSFQFMPDAPFAGNMMRPTKDGCSGFCGGCCNGGYAHFPGGGGASSFSHTTGPFCGAAGAGGLVIIYSAGVA